MEADPFFHCAEFSRIDSRDGSLEVLAFDSTTSPENTAFWGITFPFTNVATTRLA